MLGWDDWLAGKRLRPPFLSHFHLCVGFGSAGPWMALPPPVSRHHLLGIDSFLRPQARRAGPRLRWPCGRRPCRCGSIDCITCLCPLFSLHPEGDD